MGLTITAGIGVLTRLISLGLKASDAAHHEGFHKEDIAAIQALLETGAEVAKNLPRSPESDAHAHQVALITRAFGQALARHQSTRELKKGALARFLGSEERDRDKEVALRIEQAIEAPAAVADAPATAAEVMAIGDLAGSPLATRYYRTLWAAFTDTRPTLDGDRPALVEAEARREFERHFLLAYWAGLEGPAGHVVKGLQRSLEMYRAHRVRELIAADTADWRRRHVFGSLDYATWEKDQKGQIPFLPLAEMYVEPYAQEVIAGRENPLEPVLELLQRLLGQRETRVVIVRSDFGHGKSLTARTLAADFAARYLEETSTPGVDQVFPVFVKCAEDFAADAFALEATVRRAWKRQAEGFGLSLPESDDAFALPDRAQRTVVFLDGLDEVVLGDRAVESLFQALAATATDRWQFVVFSRPAVLPQKLDERKGIRTVDLLPLQRDGARGDQVAQWLTRWNRLAERAEPIAAEAVDGHGLGELAATPILLLMIALTWEQMGTGQAVPRARLYEEFFRHLARGKHERDRDRNHAVFGAGEALLEHLKRRGDVAEDADPPEAMLWLMARVAWEGARLAWRRPPADLSARPKRPLTRAAVERLLTDELGVDREAAATIQVGLLLALQADLRGGDDHILFGHQSFREFLIGRYWADRLHALVTGPEREWAKRARALLGARLLAQEDKSFDFLMELVNGDPRGRAARAWSWGDAERKTLVTWAQHVFEDESQEFTSDSTAARDDQRAVLREAALAIGSSVKGSPGLEARDPATLRSLLAWFWFVGTEPRVIASRVRSPGAILESADLREADLRWAKLAEANLSEANLREADLENVHHEGTRVAPEQLATALNAWSPLEEEDGSTSPNG
jgi:hypothetical protein